MPAYYQDIAAQECAGVIGTPMPPLARRQRVAIGRGLHPRRGLHHRPALSLPSRFPPSGDAGA
jgi:hypothetical protein